MRVAREGKYDTIGREGEYDTMIPLRHRLFIRGWLAMGLVVFD